MKVRVHVRKEAALRAGIDSHGYKVVQVPAAGLTPAQREFLVAYDYSSEKPEADFYLDRVGGSLARSHPCHEGYAAALAAFVDTTPEGVMALIDALVVVKDEGDLVLARKAEAEAAECEREVLTMLGAGPEAWVREYTFADIYSSDFPDLRATRVDVVQRLRYLAGGDPRLAGLLAGAEALVEAENARRSAEVARRESERRDEIAARKAERSDWIAAHGSLHLKKAVAAGHDCKRLYVTERARLEHPRMVLDFDDRLRWRERVCPSEEALDLAAELGGEVVWLQRPADGDEDFPECEAVVVREFLGEYDLVRVLDDADDPGDEG